MKQYLFIAVLVGMGTCVSANPFDLQKNLQKIDQDQDVLLSALKEMAETNEAEVVKEVSSPTELIKDLVIEENVTTIDESQALEEVQKVAKDEKLQEEKRLQKVKEEQIKIEQARAAQAKIEATEKAEAERREVEAYEAQRIANKKKEEARVLEAKTIADSQDVKSPMEMQEIETKKEESKHIIVDINLSREEAVAKQKAQKAYLDAVREVQ